MKRYLLASMAFCIAFTAPSAWASKAWYAEGVIRTDFRDTRISTTGCQGIALDESAGKVFFGTAPDDKATAGIAQYSLLSLTRTEGVVEPDHVAQGVDAYKSMWGRSFGAAKGFVFSCSRSQTVKGKIEVRPYTSYSAAEPTLVSLTGDLDGIADLELYPVTVNADGTSFYGCDASRLHKFTIGWSKEGAVASLTYAGSCALNRPNAITVAAVGGRELVYAIAKNETGSDLTILNVTDGAAMSVTSTATVSETGDAFGIAVSGIAAGMPHLTVAGNPKMKVLNLTADGTGADVTTPVATLTTADFFPDAGVTIANRFGLAVTDDETRMFLSVSASQHLMVSAVMPPDWTIYVKATSAKDPVTPAVPYDTEATAAPDLNTAVAYANKLGLRKVKVVGQVNQPTKLTLENVEIFGDGWNSASLYYNAELQPTYQIGENVFIHNLTITGTARSKGVFRMTAESSVISNCCIKGIYGQTAYVGSEIAGNVTAGLITHCLISGNRTNNGGESDAVANCYGAGVLSLSGTARMANSVFTGNYHNGNIRGPMDGTLSISGSAVLENCVVYGNYVKASNSTDGDGTARRRPRRGAGVFVVSGSPVIRNCIIRNNLKPLDWVEDPGGVDIWSPKVEGNINIRAGATPIIENCNVSEGQVPECAVNCQTDDPKFADPDNATPDKRDFSIAADSPCVDAGAFQKWQIDATDYTGITPRYQGEMVDIGAYEVVKPTPPTAHIELGGTLEAEKYATATMSAFVTGLKLAFGATFKWYTSDPQEGSPEPFATGNPAEYRFTEGTWTIYLKIENADGAGTDLYGSVADGVVVTRGADFYVSATGDDEASGDIDAPFQTLEHAMEVVTPGQHVKIVGAVNVNTVLTLENIEVYGDGPELSNLNLPAVTGNEMIIGDNAILRGLTLKDQFQTSHGSRFYMTGENAVVSNCHITGSNCNTANSPVGGYASSGTITHCLFYSVRVKNGGRDDVLGLPIVELAGTARMINSIMTNCGPDSNVRGPLDGVLAMSGNAILENCVIYGNRSVATASGDKQDEKSYHQKPRRGGGIFVKSGSPVIRNCIVRDNKKAHEPSDGKYPTETGEDIYAATEESDFQILAGATPKISFCNIPEGQVPECATNCQTGDPKFTDPDKTTVANRDFSIAEGSPCVDAGNGRGWRKGATDYAGNPRIQGRRVDIGAYEYNSGVVDWGLQILVR